MERVLYVIDSSDLESLVKKLFQEVLDSQEPKKEEKLFTVAETAKLLGVDRTSLWRWEKAKYLMPIRLGGRIRYKQSDIEMLCKK